jgi:hypothetical protein
MDMTSLDSCPRCGSPLQLGFAARSVGLSFVSPEKFEHFAFLDEDVSQAGLKKLLPSKAEYYRAYLCRSCKLYVVDYSKIYHRNDAEQLVKSANESE